MSRILLTSIFAAFAVSASEPPRASTMTDSKLTMPVSSRVLVFISGDGKLRVADGVTAQEIAEAWYRSSVAQQARAERCEAFVRNFLSSKLKRKR